MSKSPSGCRPRVDADDTVAQLASQIDLYMLSQSQGLRQHARNVAWLAGRLCDALELPSALRARVVRSAYSHDIGKALLPIALLEKPGPLTAGERAIVGRHAACGAQLLARLAAAHGADLSIEIETALRHHEHWDGSGYPQGVSGTQIPLPSRIVAIVDVYDALVSVRPYKAAWPHGNAVDLIRESSGSHFDPYCAAAFLELASRLPADWTTIAQAGRPEVRKRVGAPVPTCSPSARESALAASCDISIGST